MKQKLITLAAIALWLPAPAAGQATPAEIGQELKALESRWVSALVRADLKTLGQILDDSFMESDEEGNQTDKQSLLAVLKSGELAVTSVQLSNMRIHSFIYSAVVTGRAEQHGMFKGDKLALTVVFTDTFAMINGTWKLVASHRSAPHAQ